MLYRRERAGSYIKEELSLIVGNAVGDPRVQALTITDVDLTQDRRIARVYVACRSGEEDLQEGLRALENAKGFLKRELSQVLHWRFTPEIEFRVDRTWEHGSRIDALFDALKDEEATRANDVDEDEQPE